MTDIPRIEVDEARRKVQAGEAMLVCAYDDESKCARMKLEGATSVGALSGQLATLPTDRELIFYCA